MTEAGSAGDLRLLPNALEKRPAHQRYWLTAQGRHRAPEKIGAEAGLAALLRSQCDGVGVHLLHGNFREAVSVKLI